MSRRRWIPLGTFWPAMMTLPAAADAQDSRASEIIELNRIQHGFC